MSRETLHDCSSPKVFTLMCQNEVLMSINESYKNEKLKPFDTV